MTICSNNFAPDVIEKIALDPGWGHYEAIGLQRWFTNSVAPGLPGRAAAFVPTELVPENKLWLGRRRQRFSARFAELWIAGQCALRPGHRPL